jgi:hypothetical protein
VSPPVEGDRPRAAPSSHRGQADRVAQEGREGGHPGVGAARRQQEALDAIAQHLARAPDRGRRDGHADRESLDDGPAEGLLPGRHEQHVQRSQQLRHVTSLPEQHHPVAELERVDERLEPPREGAVVVSSGTPHELRGARQQQAHPRVRLAQTRDDADGVVLCLPRGELGDHAEDGPRIDRDS